MVSLLCFSCDHRNPIGSRFCNACGTPMNFRPCKHCGAINVRAAAHCHQCGETFDLAFLSEAGDDVAPVSAQPDPANAASSGAAISSRSVAWQRVVPVTAVAVALAAVLVALSPGPAEKTAEQAPARGAAAPGPATGGQVVAQEAPPTAAMASSADEVLAVPVAAQEVVTSLDATPAAMPPAATAPDSALEPLRIHTRRTESALPVVRRDLQEAKSAPVRQPGAGAPVRSTRREAVSGSRRGTSGGAVPSARREAPRGASQVVVTDGARPSTRAKRPAPYRPSTVVSAEPLCPEGRMPTGGCDLRLPKGN